MFWRAIRSTGACAWKNKCETYLTLRTLWRGSVLIWINRPDAADGRVPRFFLLIYFCALLSEVASERFDSFWVGRSVRCSKAHLDLQKILSFRSFANFICLLVCFLLVKISTDGFGQRNLTIFDCQFIFTKFSSYLSIFFIFSSFFLQISNPRCF